MFANEWKKAIIRPLIKKHGGLHLSNYRPVSNLPFLSKVVENGIGQLNSHFQSSAPLPSYQSAYRANFSCETALVSLLDDLLWAMEKQQVTQMCLMDLSAAFDTVDHKVLLEVLGNEYGLGAYLDSHLTLKTHIAAKCRAAMAGLRLVRNIRHLLTKDACHTIVLGLVISHLDYANSLYANLPNVVIMMLQRIQNMAAKLVLKRGKEDSASEALKELHWLPIRQRILHKILTLVFKCVVDKSAPQYYI
ncbi:putative RNA-directed DNA polymerase from mobile element jockey-like [Apostichopus japonicus]|uniref:Putative RNA-directed DNA polymerase from mobile element jockey-like n=1 Tax=Stichopus japonicus TaxID=307972 RepID=A0A2G8LJ45_STIJA|nr:putative RNA-directed DNA polymerase from mobile element jockey-like [Apostichopus japonicus]